MTARSTHEPARDEDAAGADGASAPEPRLARRIASSRLAEVETADHAVDDDPESATEPPFASDRVDAGAATLGRDERGQLPEDTDIEGGDPLLGDTVRRDLPGE